jgi:XRE family aerobic/anaerobic benzoate catabolism transcriptional regulator
MSDRPPLQTAQTTPTETLIGQASKPPFLAELGARVRAVRSRQGMTRKSLASAADVSKRHLANLEYGSGNPSIRVLVQVANALQCSLSELTGDITTSSPQWLLLRELLEGRDDATLRRVRIAIGELLGNTIGGDKPKEHHTRIALIGLRGAGKSTLGEMLALELGFPFVELSREIEKLAGCGIAEIRDLYGAQAYRRYERRALEETIHIYPEVVLATPGGLVSDPSSFRVVLESCTTIWLRAAPQDHMNRVAAQGDLRPIAASNEAMRDLVRIIDRRTAFYEKADMVLNTSSQSLQDTFAELRRCVRSALHRAQQR